MAHHPEKFLDGRMLWRGRIYSPLPFVRSLWGTKINAGVWGTAAFPSVYRTDVHPFAFLPHSIRWQALSLVMTLFTETGERAKALKLGDASGVEVTSVTKNSPASAAGIKEGDVLLRVGKKKITDPEDIFDASFYITAGDIVPITVMRGD